MTNEQLEMLDIYPHKSIAGCDYRVFVKSSYKANKLNKLLRYPYGKDAEFVQTSSEGIFSFHGNYLDQVVKIMQE
jgi:hypothetical protein